MGLGFGGWGGEVFYLFDLWEYMLCVVLGICLVDSCRLLPVPILSPISNSSPKTDPTSFLTLLKANISLRYLDINHYPSNTICPILPPYSLPLAPPPPPASFWSCDVVGIGIGLGRRGFDFWNSVYRVLVYFNIYFYWWIG